MEFTIKLSAQELQIAANALAQRPYGEVAAVIASMQKQVSAQETAPAAMTEEKAA